MDKTNIKIEILPTTAFLNDDNTFNKQKALDICGKIAGVCYDKEGFNHLVNEPIEKTGRRIDMTLNNGHHSVYDHITISLNIQSIPKILAMILNNEKQYTTSEKSARYTPIIRDENSPITYEEEVLYDKWIDIFKIKITSKYGKIYNDSKIIKLAQENARYLVTVFMPTQMVYTTSLRQINYLASWLKEFADANKNSSISLYQKLVPYINDFINQLDGLNILESGLLKNEKERSLSLFSNDREAKEEVFNNVYSTNYKGSFAQLAQAQRHRTLDYEMMLLDQFEFFIPPIISDDLALVREWLKDAQSISHLYPQGQLILINEKGKFEDFLLKAKERLCSDAQLEIMLQTRITLLRYQSALEKINSPLKNNISLYTRGARCTFPDYKCQRDCKFAEGKILIRKI